MFQIDQSIQINNPTSNSNEELINNVESLKQSFHKFEVDQQQGILDIINVDVEQNKDTLYDNKKDTVNRRIKYKRSKIIVCDQTHKKSKKQFKENNSGFQENQKEQIGLIQQQYQLCTLYQNEQSIINLQFKPHLKSFVVIKQNLSQQDNFEREYMILQLLKDKKITLDLVSQDTKDFQFEQLAGKSDLIILKQKNRCDHIFELYFLILYEKLNRMHDLGIAHSDIKPKNIVISYENEPFFIDFGGSVLLKNYDDYLEYFTPFFNLDVYVSKDEKSQEYKIKNFKDEEEVKLCDRTQLALTFLNLFCFEQELELFKQKDFNQIFKNLLQKSGSNNRRIVLSIISKILNQADPQIKIVEFEKEWLFLVDNQMINQELQKSNDITFNQQQNSYKVNRINQINIHLLYFLDKIGSKLDINPNEMVIVPQQTKKEYLYIYQKYKIQDYFQYLISYSILDENNLSNFCELIELLKNTQCNLRINDNNWQEVLDCLQNLKNIDTLDLNFEVSNIDIYEIIEMFQNDLPEYSIQSINLLEDTFQIKITKISNLKSKMIKVQFQITRDNMSNLDDLVSQYAESFNFIQNNFQIEMLVIDFFQMKYNSNFLDHTEKLQEYAKIIIDKCLYNNNYPFYIQIHNRIKFTYGDHELFERFRYKKKIDGYNYPNMYRFKNTYYEIQQKIKQFKDNTQNNNQLLIDLKNFQCQNEEKIICKALENIQKQIQTPSKIIIQFGNFLFQKKYIWKEFQKIIQEHQVEIIVINCQFSKKVVNMLKVISQKFSQIKYEFYDEFYHSYTLDYKEYKYLIKFQYLPKEQQLQKGLKILFYKKFAISNVVNYENNQFIDTQVNQEYQNNEYDKKYINTNVIQDILGHDQIYNDSIQNELKIPEGQLFNVIKFKSINNQANLIEDEDGLKFIIKEIQNSKHFNKINVQINNKGEYFQNQFVYEDKFTDGEKNDNYQSQPHQEIQNYIFKNKKNQNYTIIFTFNDLEIGDKTFRILFEGIEKIYPQNEKKYELNGCQITKQTLYNIYYCIVRNQSNQKIEFDLKQNDINYKDLIEFIKNIIFDYLNFQFIFEIYTYENEIKQSIKDELKGLIQIQETDEYLTLICSTESIDQEYFIQYKISLEFYKASYILQSQPKINLNVMKENKNNLSSYYNKNSSDQTSNQSSINNIENYNLDDDESNDYQTDEQDNQSLGDQIENINLMDQIDDEDKNFTEIQSINSQIDYLNNQQSQTFEEVDDENNNISQSSSDTVTLNDSQDSFVNDESPTHSSQQSSSLGSMAESNQIKDLNQILKDIKDKNQFLDCDFIENSFKQYLQEEEK